MDSSKKTLEAPARRLAQALSDLSKAIHDGLDDPSNGELTVARLIELEPLAETSMALMLTRFRGDVAEILSDLLGDREFLIIEGGILIARGKDKDEPPTVNKSLH